MHAKRCVRNAQAPEQSESYILRCETGHFAFRIFRSAKLDISHFAETALAHPRGLRRDGTGDNSAENWSVHEFQKPILCFRPETEDTSIKADRTHLLRQTEHNLLMCAGLTVY